MSPSAFATNWRLIIYSGWGTLALADESFITVNTVEELIGGKYEGILPASNICSQPMANVEPCIQAIPHNPCPKFPAGDRMHHMHIIMPGQNALHAIANFLGAAGDAPSDASGEESNSNEEQFEDGQEEDDEEQEEDDDMDEEEMNDDAGEPEDDAESDVSWAGDEFIEEAILDTVLNEASTQTDINEPQAAESNNTQTWSASHVPNVLTAAHPAGVLTEIMEARTLSKPEPVSPLWLNETENMVYFPHTGRITPTPPDTRQLARFLKRPRETSAPLPSSLGTISRGYHLLRMYEKDLEMRSLRPQDVEEEKEVGIYCPNVLTFGHFHDQNLRPYFRATSRLNMVVHVPELSLVVVGSPMGRVLLLTPTRLSTRVSVEDGFWSHGLRVEWVLPRDSDDICHDKQRRPLHGVAIGPVQDERGVGSQGSVRASVPRRYRLMLHYRNHDIASFEITRQEQTGKICIF